jgi:pyridoxine 5-phosphate synthase
MTQLSVNVNKIATLRNTRELEIPNIVKLATIALDAGAKGITVHPRPDERHIRAYDVDALAKLVSQYHGREYNIEGNPFHGLVEHCLRVYPHQATLVPDAREAFTSNHGWNLVELANDSQNALQWAIEKLHDIGARVSLFVDPIEAMMPIAKRLGADRVELYTEPFAAGYAQGRAAEAVAPYVKAAAAARESGLGVNAGHDLNLDNLAYFRKHVGDVDEVSIGHALIADALEFGLASTVEKYLAECS